MKKRIIGIILLSIFFQIPTKEVIAEATASASIKVSTTNTVVGNSGTATLTISSNEAIGQIYGTFTCGDLGKQDLFYVASASPSKVKTYTINWKGTKAGSYTCTVEGLEIGTLETISFLSPSVSSKTIKVVKATSSSGNSSSGNTSSGNSNSKPSNGGTTSNKKEYNSDNTLKSLSIEGYNLEPKFNKDTIEYKLSVDQSVEKIKVNATANDAKAIVKGTGEINLSSGDNTIEIKVTAENGNQKTYKIIVNVSDLHPIKVKIDEEELTIVKKNNNLIDKLNHYDEITLTIDNQEVIGYENTTTNITLVLLKDKDNKIKYYIYDKIKNTYTEYHYITINGVTLQLLNADYKLDHYTKYNLELQNEKIDYYKIKGSHKVGLIYGTNLKTGNTGYYVYDQNEETLSKYYDEEVEVYKNEVKTLKNYLMIFIGITAFISIITIIISLGKSKKKRKNKYKF